MLHETASTEDLEKVFEGDDLVGEDGIKKAAVGAEVEENRAPIEGTHMSQFLKGGWWNACSHLSSI